jgi:hypothetical protein
MKVGEASVCLTCDELYSRKSGEQHCPSCGERKSIPLALFFKPMTSVKPNGGVLKDG